MSVNIEEVKLYLKKILSIAIKKIKKKYLPLNDEKQISNIRKECKGINAMDTINVIEKNISRYEINVSNFSSKIIDNEISKIFDKIRNIDNKRIILSKNYQIKQ